MGLRILLVFFITLCPPNVLYWGWVTSIMREYILPYVKAKSIKPRKDWEKITRQIKKHKYKLLRNIASLSKEKPTWKAKGFCPRVLSFHKGPYWKEEVQPKVLPSPRRRKKEAFAFLQKRLCGVFSSTKGGGEAGRVAARRNTAICGQVRPSAPNP